MTDRYKAVRVSEDRPPIDGRTLKKIIARASRIDDASQKSFLDGQAWKKRYIEEFDGDTSEGIPYTEELLVFQAASGLYAAKLSNQRIRFLESIREDYGYELPSAKALTYEHAGAAYLLESRVYDMTLSDIFNRGEELVRENPAGVYGFMIRSSVLPEQDVFLDYGTHAFMAITGHSTKELKDMCRENRFPSQIGETLLELSILYDRAWSEVRSGFFDPDSVHFPSVVELSKEIMVNGTPTQTKVFLAQILGTNTTDNGRLAYRTMKALVDEGIHPDFYEGYLTIIEDSFDGLIGDEMYELLCIDRSAETEDDSEGYRYVHLQKQQLLRLIKDDTGEIILNDGEYGGLNFTSPKISYKKNKSKTHATLKATIEVPNREAIPFYFALGEGNSFSWAFLKDQSGVPELFNIIVASTKAAFDRAIAGAERIPRALANGALTVNGHKKRYTDEVYEIRKDVRQKAKTELSSDEPSNLMPRAEDKNRIDPVKNPLPVIFPNYIADSLDNETRAKAEAAIAKYGRGVPNIRKVTSLTVDGRVVFRLRCSNVRVLVEQKEEVLEVIAVGDRKTIYG